MAKRRGNGEGTVKELGPKRYKAIFTVSWNPRKTKCKTFQKKAAAQAWLAQQRSERDAGTKPQPVSDMFFCDWVTSYLADIERGSERGTHALYDQMLNLLVVPKIGSIPLRDLQPMMFRNLLKDVEEQTILSEMAKEPDKRDLTKTYKQSRTLESVYEITSRCLAAAVRMELIPRNPMAQVPRPKYSRKDIRPFTPEETKSILAQAWNHRLHGLFYLAFALGLRQGELFALQWADVDWKLKTLRIERQAVNHSGHIVISAPKTKTGRRTLELSDEAILALIRRRALAMKEGQMDNPLIFPARQGGYIQRSSFATRHWKKLLAKCGLALRGLHHARHTFATTALTHGCPIHVVSKILGHSSPTITLEAYGHLIDSAQRDTIESVARLFSTTSKLRPPDFSR